MRRPFIFTSLGVVRGESKRGNQKCGPENDNPYPQDHHDDKDSCLHDMNMFMDLGV